MMLSSALMCLALNIYHEARSELIPAQYAVALVTMNRAKWDDAEVCKVVLKNKQFSWTIDRVKHGKLTRKGIPYEREAWHKAQIIARVTLERRMSDITNGATHYHATYVSPRWRHSATVLVALGKHIFYRFA